ncbi:hypothetical protein V6N12_021945 [Hibiscus sabdariffa]|uniref:Formin-like protein n=2 Tax=Hibiscus sabdariffa TaxID=183260 RepID=A0ABR2FTE5_9ROSI
MSDEEHHFESKADAGASKTYPQQAGTIRKNGYIVIKGRPCKVVEVSTSKTGKHGHAKCHFVAIDIFTAKKLEDIVPSSHNCDVPHVNRTDYQLIDISEDGFVSLLTDSGDTKDDLRLPTDDSLLKQIKDGFAEGKDLVVSVMSAMGEEQICALKDIGPKRLFYRKPPDRLLEISERVYVFDCCFTADVMEEDDFKVKFTDPDAVVPRLTRVTTSEDGNEIESGSPEEFFEVEEIFSNVVDMLDGKVHDGSLAVHDKKLEQKDVRREDVDPHRFQELASNDGNKKQDVKVDSRIDAVKDIAVDDVNYKLHKKMDSDTNAVKDIAVDEGDIKVGSVEFTIEALRDRETNYKLHKKMDSNTNAVKDIAVDEGDIKVGSVEFTIDALRDRETKAVTEDVIGKLEDVEDSVSREDIVPLKRPRLETVISSPKPEKLPPASKKWSGLFPKTASDSALVKPKSKQLESHGHHARQAKPNAISRWIPPNKGSFVNSMHVSYPSSRHSSASLSGTMNLRKSKSGSNLKVFTGAVISKDVLFRQKSLKVDHVKAWKDVSFEQKGQKVDHVKASDCTKEIFITPIIPTSLPGLEQSVYIPPSTSQPSPSPPPAPPLPPLSPPPPAPPLPPLPPRSPPPPRPSLLVSQSLQENTFILPSLPAGDVSRMPSAASPPSPPPTSPPSTVANVHNTGMVSQSPVAGLPMLSLSSPLSNSQTTLVLLSPPPSSSRKSRYFSASRTVLHFPPPSPPHPSSVGSLGTSKPGNIPSLHPQPPPTTPIQCVTSPPIMHEVLSTPSLPLTPSLCDSPSPPSLPPPVPSGHGPLPPPCLPPCLPPLPPPQYRALAPLLPPMPLHQLASSPPPLPPPFLHGTAYGHSPLPSPMPCSPSPLSPSPLLMSIVPTPLASSPLSPLMSSALIPPHVRPPLMSGAPNPLPPPSTSSALPSSPLSALLVSSAPLPPSPFSVSSAALPPSPPPPSSMSTAPLPSSSSPPSSIFSAPPPPQPSSMPSIAPPPPLIIAAPLPPPSPPPSTSSAPLPPPTSPPPQLVSSSPHFPQPISSASLSLPPSPPSLTISVPLRPPSYPPPQSVSTAPPAPPSSPSSTTSAPPPSLVPPSMSNAFLSSPPSPPSSMTTAPPPPPPFAPPSSVSSAPPPPPSLVSSAPPPPPSLPTQSMSSAPLPPLPPSPSMSNTPPPPPPPVHEIAASTLSPMNGAPPPPPPPPPPGVGPPPPPPPPGGGAPPPPPPPGGGAPPPPPPPGGQAPSPPAPPGAPGGGPPPPPGARGRGRGPSRLGAISTAKKSSLKPLHWSKVSRAIKGSLWEELQRHGEPHIAPEFDVSELETLFSAVVPKRATGGKGKGKSGGSKTDKVHLIDLRRANNTEIMLTKVKMPLPDMMAAVLAMDDTVLDVDQVENLLKFCPTKEEMELLKNYTGDKGNLGKCEQYFLELIKVPRVESKMGVFSFKIQFRTQISEFRRSLETVHSACEEVRNSDKLKEIMKKILYLGNTLNQGTARGSAVGFKLDSLLKLTDTRASISKMTLMHYLCKVLAEKNPGLLDFHLEFVSLEAAAKIQLKALADEMQAIIKGLEKVKQELAASENDGPVSDVFCKTLKEFVSGAEAEAESVTNLYSEVSKNADSLALYFGEDPARCPFEQVTSTLLNFVRLFQKAHDENIKQAEIEQKQAGIEQKKVEKEGEMDKGKGEQEAE